MRIQILGTAAAEGWPAVFCRCEYCKRARELGGKNIRTRSGAIVDDVVMIDLSPDTYAHALRFDLDLLSVESVLITHDHQDHYYPEELSMRGPTFSHLVDAPPVLTVYGGDRVGESLAPVITSTGQPPRLAYQNIRAFQPFDLPSGHRVTPLRALHDRSMECLLYLLQKDGMAILYGHDTGLFPEETMEVLKGIHLDIVLLDCTSCGFTEGTNHMGFPDNLVMRDRLAAIGCVDAHTQMVITHFSHNGHLLHDELCALAEPEGFTVAYDGIVLNA